MTAQSHGLEGIKRMLFGNRHSCSGAQHVNTHDAQALDLHWKSGGLHFKLVPRVRKLPCESARDRAHREGSPLSRSQSHHSGGKIMAFLP